VWHFQSALAAAAATDDPGQVIAALERAVAAYDGDLCALLDALWAEPVREDLHRRALDAHIRLAEAYADGRPERAAAVLEATIELDPICEEAYRRLITLQAHLGHRDAAQRTWRLLQGRLAELDFEPEEVTVDLIHELLRQPPTRVRRVSTGR
jgi:DNA-binding SARP family transcriptional activator